MMNFRAGRHAGIGRRFSGVPFRTSQSSDYTSANRVLQEESSVTSQFISEMAAEASKLFPSFLNDERRLLLLTLFGIDSDLCETFLNLHDTVRAAFWLEQELLINLSQQLDS